MPHGVEDQARIYPFHNQVFGGDPAPCKMSGMNFPQIHADKSCLTRWIAKFQGGALEQPVDPRLLLERWEAEDAAMSVEEAHRNSTN